MKKNELKTGMVVQFNNQEIGFILGNKIYDGDFYCIENLSKYNDNLKIQITPAYEIVEYRINKVFEINSNILDIKELFDIVNNQFHSDEDFIEYLLNNDYLNLLWERQEIDWEQIPRFTPVLVRNTDLGEWEHAYFLGCTPEGYYETTYQDEFLFNNSDEPSLGSYRQIKLPKQNTENKQINWSLVPPFTKVYYKVDNNSWKIGYHLWYDKEYQMHKITYYGQFVYENYPEHTWTDEVRLYNQGDLKEDWLLWD